VFTRGSLRECSPQGLRPWYPAMGVLNLASRFTAYYQRHGLSSTAQRASLALKRGLSSNRMVLYYCDLTTESSPAVDMPGSLNVEQKRNLADLSAQEVEALTTFWNPRQASHNLAERFNRKAILWLIRLDGELAGYGWTLRGETIEPHYFPLAPCDAHLFDFHVFAQYRGRGINPLLVGHILRSLASDGCSRAFIEAAEWNGSQLASLSKTAFRRLGWARKLTIFRQPIILWDGADGPKRAHNSSERGKLRPVREGNLERQP